MLERYTTRQRQPKSTQYPAQVKSDDEAVLEVEMCGAVRCSAIWCAVVLEGELRRGRGRASNGAAAARAATKAKGFRCARKMRKSDDDASTDGCDIATTATGEERAMMAGRRGRSSREGVSVGGGVAWEYA